MVERKPFLLRLDPATMAALRAWANDDLRSLNGQIEFLLRRALREAGRLPPPRGRSEPTVAAADGGGHGAARDVMNGGGAAAVPATRTPSEGRGDG